MRALTLALVGLVGLGGLGACGGSPPPEPAATLELGAIDASGQFSPIADGADVTLVAGAQGGFHVWLGYRVTGMASGATRLERWAHRKSDGQLVLRMASTIEIGAPASDGSWQPADPIPMFMCPSPIGLSVIDQPIVFELELPDAQLSRSVTLVPHCPDAERDFCVRICSG